MLLETFIGAAAPFCTTISYIPQLKKVWTTGETGDLSRDAAFARGRTRLWIIYGFLKSDFVIIAANGVSVTLLSCIIFFKMREGKSDHDPGRHRRAA